VRRAAAALPLALEFLTVLRLRHAAAYDGPTLGVSLGWFPLVGLGIGALLAALDWVAGLALAPPAVAALLAACPALITRGLHLDGLADSADGLFGGHTPERRLAIMKDSRTGSFGATGIALVLLLQYAALLSLSGPARWAVLLLVPALARAAMVVAVALFPYARPEGLGRLYHAHARPGPLLAAAGTSALLALALLGAGGLVLWLVAGGLALLLGRFASARLGGLTGDIYGAVGVLTEVVLLLAAASATEHGWLRPWWTP
jgi:adenosylcobinamide-GDP ribazoletransferase